MSDDLSIIDIIVDIGNSLWKVMVQGRPSTARVFPHAIKYVSERKFATEGKRFTSGYHEMHDLDYGTFAYKHRKNGAWETAYVSAGSTAKNKETEGMKAGAEKYIREYYGVALSYLLLQVIPEGHDNIRLTVGHPASDIEYRDAMIDSVIGNHYLQLLNGDKVKYTIKSIIPYEEGVAAARNWVYTRDGVHYRPMSQEFEGAMGLDLNIGGGISSITPHKPDTGWIDYGGSTSIGTGINDIMANVASDIIAEYSDKFTDNKDDTLPNDDRMQEAMTKGVYWQNGYSLDVKHIVDENTAVFRNQIRTAVVKAGGVSRFRFVTISGGGGGYLWNTLLNNDTLRFNKDFIFPAVDTDQGQSITDIHLSVLYGADKTTSAHLYKMSQSKTRKARKR